MTGLSLPALRTDIELLPDATAPDGSPTYTLEDPVSGTYHRLGWGEATALSCWEPGLSLDGFSRRIRMRTTLRLEDAELARFVREVHALGLVRPTPAVTGDQLEDLTRRRSIGWFHWLVHHYLYIRVPLLSPDRFLAATWPFVRPLVSVPALGLYLLVGLAGLVLLASRVDEYLSTFPHYLTGSGALAYGAVIVGLKVLHEFGHAYSARAMGIRVRSMGIVFLVCWPVPFSDVTDAWRLSSRWRRLLIGLGGVAVELVLAGLALFGWCLAPPGMLRSFFYLVSSVTLATTLIANLNPAMRFDGYYILSDLWGIENLQERAFRMTRWSFRRLLLGLRAPPPEEISGRRLAGFVAYSVFSWTYRVSLYLAIALVVYRFFIKAVGVVLFAVEIYFFFLRPIASELRFLMRQRRSWAGTRRGLAALVAAGALVAFLAVPTRQAATLPAIAVPEEQQDLFVPVDGFLVDVAIERGASVRAGQVLFRIDSPALASDVLILEREAAILAARHRNALTEPSRADELPGIALETARNEVRLRAAVEAERSTRVVSTIPGSVVAWEMSLRPGQAVAMGERLGRIATTGRRRLVAYLDEGRIDFLQAGDTVAFYPDRGGPAIEAQVASIRSDPVEALRHPVLTSAENGDLAVLPEASGSLVPVETLFEVELVATEDLDHGTTGRVRFLTPARSRLASMAERVWRVLLRESSF